MAVKKPVPFDFVFEYLEPLAYTVKPFFGCHGVYIGDKIVLMLRDKKDHPDANGVWIATTREEHESLKKDFTSMCSIALLNEGKGETSWQMLPASADDFESAVLQLCSFIRRGDKRIGRVPKKKKKK